MNCYTSSVKIVDYYLQLEVKKLKSYVKKLEAIDYISDDAYLVFSDVCFSYTNTPNKEGIETCFDAWHVMA